MLEDGTRVLAQRGLQSGIGLSEGGGKGGARKMAALMGALEEKGIDTKGLIARANSPIRFIPPHGGNPADGYEASILPDICAAPATGLDFMTMRVRDDLLRPRVWTRNAFPAPRTRWLSLTENLRRPEREIATGMIGHDGEGSV